MIIGAKEVWKLTALLMVASFCYLNNMLAAAEGFKLGVTQGEGRLEEVQGATVNHHIHLPQLQDLWPCIELLHGM